MGDKAEKKKEIKKAPPAPVPQGGSVSVGPGVPNSAMLAMLGVPDSGGQPDLKEKMMAKIKKSFSLPGGGMGGGPVQDEVQEPPQGGVANFLYGSEEPPQGEVADFLYGGGGALPQGEAQEDHRNALQPEPQPEPQKRKNYIKYLPGTNTPKIDHKNFSSTKKMNEWIEGKVGKRNQKLKKINDLLDKGQVDKFREQNTKLDKEMNESLLPKSVRKKLTQDELASITAYTSEPHEKDTKSFGNRKDPWTSWSNSYYGMNNFLRFNAKTSWEKDAPDIPEEYHEGIKKHINNVTSAISKSTMSHGQVMYRGVSRNGFKAALGLKDWPMTQEEANALVGRKFSDPGFTSTSWERDVAERFATDTGVILTVILPKGTQAMYLRDYSESQDERELLLQKGSEMTIRSASVNRNGLRELTVEVTSQNANMLDEKAPGEDDGFEVMEKEDFQPAPKSNKKKKK